MKRNIKSIYLILILLIIFGISVGYAAINKVLSISGNSEVKQNTWDLYFDNIRITDRSVIALKEPTLENSNLSVDFSVNLDLPGDFYEFTVDVKNAGTIDAMIESIEKTPELTAEQQKYINYIVEYQDGRSIEQNQIVSKNDFVRIKVRLEYRNDITEVDLPTTYQSLDLSFTLNYIQADSNGTVIKNNGIISASGDINQVGTVVSIGTEKFYTIGVEGDNVKLLSMYNLYVGYTYNKDNDPSYSAYLSTEATGMQDSRMVGATSSLTNVDRYGVVAFATSSKHGVNYSDYSGSRIEKYVNDYKTILENRFEVSIVEARLITEEELTSEIIGCSSVNHSCNAAPDFITSTSYWTMTPSSTNPITSIKAVQSYDKNIVSIYYSIGSTGGVRPVIIIPKTYFE